MERSSDERREREGERLKDYVFATMICGCGRWWFKLKPQDWWPVLSFEAPAMAVVMVACVEF